MPYFYYPQYFTRLWNPGVREALYDLLFIHRGRVQSCTEVCSQTKPIYFKAMTPPCFIRR